MKSNSTGSRASSTDSPKESPRWTRAHVDQSQRKAITVGQSIVADGWSRTRIHGAQDSATVVYRHSDARREAMRRRLREALNK